MDSSLVNNTFNVADMLHLLLLLSGICIPKLMHMKIWLTALLEKYCMLLY